MVYTILFILNVILTFILVEDILKKYNKKHKKNSQAKDQKNSWWVDFFNSDDDVLGTDSDSSDGDGD